MTTPAPSVKSPRRRRWLRRLLWAVAILAAIRLLLALLLPWVLTRVAAIVGLNAEIGGASLIVVQGKLTLKDVVLRETPGADGKPGKVIARLDYLLAHVDVSELFGGHLVVERADVDGVYGNFERDARGKWNWDLFNVKGDGSPAPAPVSTPAGAPAARVPGAPAVEFDSFLTIREARVRNVRAHYSDASLTKPVNLDAWVDVSVTGYSIPYYFESARVLAGSPQALDLVHVQASFTGWNEDGESTFGGHANVKCVGLRPGALDAFLTPAGIEPRAARVAAAVNLTLSMQEDRRVEPYRERPDPEEAGWLAFVRLDDVALDADGERQAGVDDARLVLSWLPGRALRDVVGSVKGFTAQAERFEDGALAALGFRFVPSSAAPSAPARSEAADFDFELDAVDLTEGSLRFRDRVGDDVVDLTYEIEKIAARDLRTDPLVGGDAGTLDLTARIPGIVDSVHSTLTMAPRCGGFDAGASVAWRGVRLDRVKPYLDAAGLASDLDAGELTARLTGSLRIDARGEPALSVAVDELSLRDHPVGAEPRQLAELRGSVEGLRVGAKGVEVGRAALTRLRLPVKLQADGTLWALGLEKRPGKAAEAGAPAPRREGGGAETLDIGEVDAGDARIDLEFPWNGGSRTTALTLTSARLRRLQAGGAAPELSEATLALQAEGLAEGLDVQGTVARGLTGGAEARARVQLRGADASFWEPILAGAGVRPTFRKLDGDLTLSAAFAGGRPASLHLTDVELRGDGAALVAWKGIRVGDVRDDGGLRVGHVESEGPALGVTRRADGGLTIAGFDLTGAPAEPPGTKTTTGPKAPAPSPAPATPQAPANGPPFEIGDVAVKGAVVRFEDLTTGAPFRTEARLDAMASGLAAGAGAAEFPAHVKISVPDAIESVAVDLDLRLDPAALAVKAAIEATGVRGGALAAYLPPGVRLTPFKGHLTARASVSLESAGAATSAKAELRDVAWGEAGSSPTFRFDRLAVDAPVLDGAGKRYEIDACLLEGVELTVVKQTSGALDIGGLTVEPAAKPESAPAPPSPAPSGRPLRPTSGVVLLEKLALGIERLEFRNLSKPDREPLRARVELTNLTPLRLGQGQAEEAEDHAFKLSASVDDAVRSFEAVLTGAIFAPQPDFGLEIDARGIDGPALVERLDLPVKADDLKNGELTGRIDVSLDMRRSDPFDFNLARPFGVQISADGFALRGEPGGPVLAGFESLSAEAKRIDLTRRDVQVQRVEWTHPTVRVDVEKEGLRVFGVLVPFDVKAESASAPASSREPAPPPVPASAPATGPAASRPAPAQSLPASGAPPWNVTVGEFSLGGMEIAYRDSRGDPPFIVPISALDFQVRRFSTRALREEIPVHFGVNIESGTVALPKRHERSSFLAGIAEGTVKLATGHGEAAETESRPFFESVTAGGNLTFAGAPRGDVHVNIGGLELASLRGLAKRSGVQIGDGVLDSRVTVKLEGERGTDVETKNTFSHLSISESAGGPIATYLRLPMPLDTVLFILRNENDEQRVNFNVHIGAHGVSTAAIIGQSVEALSTAIARAVAGSPIRIGASVLGAIPLDTSLQKGALPIGRVSFEPVEWSPSSREWRGIQKFVDEILGDSELTVRLSHEFSAEDVERLDKLANPDAQDCLEFVRNVRQRRFELFRQRDELAARARTSYWVGRVDDAEDAITAVQALERVAGELDSGLDQILERIRPRIPGAAQRRARLACITLANLRLARVKSELEARGVKPERIDLRPARVDLASEGDRSGVVLTARRQR